MTKTTLLIDSQGVIREVTHEIPLQVNTILSYSLITQEQADTIIAMHNPLSSDGTVILPDSYTDPGSVIEYYRVDNSPLNNYHIFSSTNNLSSHMLTSLLTWYQNKVANKLADLTAGSEIPEEVHDGLRSSLGLPVIDLPNLEEWDE